MALINISAIWFVAAYHGDSDTLEILLRQGVDVNEWQTMDAHSGMTALHHSALNVHLDCVRLLIASGADVNADYDLQPGWRGWTPLMCAVEAQIGGNPDENSESVEIVRLLLESGADPNIRHVDTALELAEANHYQSIAHLLRQAGARQ